MKVTMKVDLLYEGKEFKKGDEYEKDKLPSRFLSDNYVEFPPEEKPDVVEKIEPSQPAKPVELEKIPATSQVKTEVKATDRTPSA